MINQQFIDRIDALPDVFMLASLVQFKYIQTISQPNEHNFVEDNDKLALTACRVSATLTNSDIYARTSYGLILRDRVKLI